MKLINLVAMATIVSANEEEPLIKPAKDLDHYPGSNYLIGKCPYAPGDLESKVKDTIDLRLMAGPWINIFSEKDYNKALKCLGYKFDHFDDNALAITITALSLEQDPETKASDYQMHLGEELLFAY